MNTAAKYRLYTFEEFCEIVPEGQKADLIDGIIYMASPDNIEHYHINRWLAGLIEQYLRETDIGGDIFGYRIAFRLGKSDSPEPDLAYLQESRLHLVRKTYVDGKPDMAIEIVSPDSIERDYKKKHKQYEEAGVEEYWIIDPIKTKFSAFVLSEKNKFKPVRAKSGKVCSLMIPGFWVRPSWFWETPLPQRDEVLAEIRETEAHE